jgi:hypothetical protein
LIIFGVEYFNEDLTFLVGRVRRIIEDFLEMKITEQDLGRVYRIGNRRWRRCILLKLTTFWKKMEI